jgi:hypothetical protein
MEQLIQYLPFLIPVAVAEFALMITALVHILRHDRYKYGSRVLWMVIVIFVGIIGPILYFTLGRSDD